MSGLITSDSEIVKLGLLVVRCRAASGRCTEEGDMYICQGLGSTNNPSVEAPLSHVSILCGSNHGPQRDAATDRHGVCSRIKLARKQSLQPTCIDIPILNNLLHKHLEETSVQISCDGKSIGWRKSRVLCKGRQIDGCGWRPWKRGDALFCTRLADKLTMDLQKSAEHSPKRYPPSILILIKVTRWYRLKFIYYKLKKNLLF